MDNKVYSQKELEGWIKIMAKELPTHEMSAETKKCIGEVSTSVKLIASHFEDKGIVDRIDKRVHETNGRVKKLELWKAGLVGGVLVITVIFPTFFIYFMNDLRHDVSNKITEAIESNNNKYFE